MNKSHELSVEVIGEYGYHQSMVGLSYNKDQTPDHMMDVSKKLCAMDHGHNKFLEHIFVWLEVRAPRYWWQEADTFRLSSKNSQSTMHTILRNELTPDNFECGDLDGINVEYLNGLLVSKELVLLKRKLPEGFMQKRMWNMNYKTLRNIIIQRINHRLPHWQTFIHSVKEQVEHPELLPYRCHGA